MLPVSRIRAAGLMLFSRDVYEKLFNSNRISLEPWWMDFFAAWVDQKTPCPLNPQFFASMDNFWLSKASFIETSAWELPKMTMGGGFGLFWFQNRSACLRTKNKNKRKAKKPIEKQTSLRKKNQCIRN